VVFLLEYMEQFIKVRGARQHNLKNIDVDIPKNKLVVFTGLSGSGKSSLAFDTIYAEGQRRYVESLSSYARQFLGIMNKPDVDTIEGLSPAISIDQKSTSHNPRSTVGTVTEIYDYLRLLFARIGHPHCPNCGREIRRQSPDQIVNQIIARAKAYLIENDKGEYRFFILSPVIRDRKGEFSNLFDNLKAKGYRKVRVDKSFFDLSEEIILIKTNKHSIDTLMDTISINRKKLKNIALASLRSRLYDSVEQALTLSQGLVIITEIKDSSFGMPAHPKFLTDYLYSEKLSCPNCNLSMQEIEPRSFSFNSPHGACFACGGIGSILTVIPELIINPNLSISEGGILPFAKLFISDTWYSRLVLEVAKKYEIDVRQPLSSLTQDQKEVLLHGTGNNVFVVNGTNRLGEMTSIHEPFKGFIPELLRRHSETESEYLRYEIEKYMRRQTCTACEGRRLRKESLTITVNNYSIADVADMSIQDCINWTGKLQSDISNLTEKQIALPITNEILSRLMFLRDVGLEYLTLSRSATTLSGGESQRIRLASQIGSGLSGVLYVLDEPSIGLHQKDNGKLIKTLMSLRDIGNTVLVVEHDREMIENADFLFDFGPGAGKHGGTIVASGTVNQVKKNPKSVTGSYLYNRKQIKRRIFAKTKELESLTIVGASQNNLKNINVEFPLHKFICITGVSGSGKSSLVVETLYPALANKLNPINNLVAGKHKEITGLEFTDKVVLIDQSPIGRTPRSNPVTYTGTFSYIRDLYSILPESRLRGYKPGRFSFNVKGGRCETCEGEGQKIIEMQFLSDIFVTCEACFGSRFNTQTLEVEYHGKNISQVLDMTAEEALSFFANYSHIRPKLQTLVDVGLGYIHLGQPAPTLSGGEAQRVKIASELSRRNSGRTVYILDEPTTGLHFVDLEKLMNILHRLTELGNTVVVIEHNLDVIRNADWIIDLGPEGGDRGGYIIAAGTPRDIRSDNNSVTGKYL